MVNTVWCRDAGFPNKLYWESGQFSGTIKDSLNVNSIDTNTRGISHDAVNTPWCGDAGNKLYLQSGLLTSTMKDSEDVSATDVNVTDVSWNNPHTPWTGNLKLHEQSGQFTATVRVSIAAKGTDYTQGISEDENGNHPHCGWNEDQLFLKSGWTTTLKTSQGTASNTDPAGISYHSGDTPWCSRTTNKLLKTSGQFTATIKTSRSVGVEVGGICIDDPDLRLGAAGGGSQFISRIAGGHVIKDARFRQARLVA